MRFYAILLRRLYCHVKIHKGCQTLLKGSIEISIRSGKLKNMSLTLGELNKNSSLELKQVLVIVFKIKTTCRGVTTITYCLFITFLDFTEERDHNDAPLTRIAQSVKSFIPYKVCCRGVTTITYCLSHSILRFHRRKRPQ